jgi:hypothetical protein
MSKSLPGACAVLLYRVRTLSGHSLPVPCPCLRCQFRPRHERSGMTHAMQSWLLPPPSEQNLSDTLKSQIMLSRQSKRKKAAVQLLDRPFISTSAMSTLSSMPPSQEPNRKCRKKADVCSCTESTPTHLGAKIER